MRTETGTRQRTWRQQKAKAEGRTLRLRSGRPRKYASLAARQAAYRQRKAEARVLDAIFGAGSVQP